MILYLPERLYDEIKDNQDFIDISEQMEDIYTEKSTFEHAITTNWVDNDEIKALGIKLDKLIETFFKDKPNYIEEYKINNGKYSKQEMTKTNSSYYPISLINHMKMVLIPNI